MDWRQKPNEFEAKFKNSQCLLSDAQDVSRAMLLD
jgi:hypothetical protein